MFGEHNHIVLDNYNEDTAYYIGASGAVYCVTVEGEPVEVWNVPESGLPRSYNPALIFPGDQLAVLSDGTGTLFILDTGNRK